MITCERCQTENIEGSQFCDECGAILPGAPSVGSRRTSDSDDSKKTSVVEKVVAPETRAEVMQEPVEVPAGAKSNVIASPARTSVGGQPRTRDLEESSPRRAASGAAPHAKLVIHRGRSVGKEFPISEDESHIGRWDADGGIFPDVDLDSDDPEAKVSRRHARITHRGGQYYIEDLGSTNGTFVNRGRRLLPGDRQLLRDGDEVIVGKTFLKFHVLDK
ncbi:MAG TPA: FHA domain-containing protein [Pyrinomonadaceae bacterium]|nr:FHA domain-containing protein [Pyrinomonadaceae bacterium]